MMIPVTTLNGVITQETCPVCLEPGVEVEHGWVAYLDGDKTIERHDLQEETWYCPECGESVVRVMDCPHCEPVKEAA